MQIHAPLTSEILPALQEVEVATFFQIPGLQIIGLPGPEVAEARDRIRSAIDSSRLEFPRRRVVVNLSPASLRKRGTGLDLAMALAILFEKKDSPPTAAWGELGLDGQVKSVGQMVRVIYAVWKKNIRYLLLAEDDFEAGQEALEWIQEGEGFVEKPPALISVKNLHEAWTLVSRNFSGFKECREPLARPIPDQGFQREGESGLLALSPDVERNIGVIASGVHHFLCIGPKGTGKSHAVEWLKAVLPDPSPKEKLEHRLMAELVWTPSKKVSGKNRESEIALPGLDSFLPIRRVGTQVRPAALIGSRSSAGAGPPFGWIRPGEFSLAHGGILIADEIPEWSRDSRESLREPLERGWVTLTRVHGSSELPARFLLAATGNFCPCGGWPPEIPRPSEKGAGERNGGAVEKDRTLICDCPLGVRRRYLSQLNGPVLDRLDLVLVFCGRNRVVKEEMFVGNPQVQIDRLREKVRVSRLQMRSLWGEAPGLLSGATLERLLVEHPSWSLTLSEYQHASLRSRHKMLRLAMSLAVWDGLEEPRVEQFAEAFCYRAERIQFLH